MKKQFFAALGAAVLLTAALGCTAFAASDKEIKVRTVAVEPDSITVRVNQTRTLGVYIRPYNAEDQTVYWETEDPDIAVVDMDGHVTGISPGTTKVFAVSVNGKTGSCKVTVPAHVLKGIETDVENAQTPGAEISGGETISALALRSDVEKAVKDGAKSLTYNDKSQVSTASLRGAAYAAQSAGGQVQLKFATTSASETRGEADFFFHEEVSPKLQGWLVIDPKLAPKEDYQVGTWVWAEQDRVGEEQAKARQTLGGKTALIRLSHSGDFGMTVSVAAKAELGTLDPDTLALYHWDSATGSCTLLADQRYTLDQNGYLHFNTTKGGCIAITSK